MTIIYFILAWLLGKAETLRRVKDGLKRLSDAV